MRIIKEACNKQIIKHKARKKIEKRRNHKFNWSVAALSIPEGAEIPYSEKPQNGNSQTIKNYGLSRNVQEQNSDDEVIFSDLTAIERPAINQRKRSVESDNDDICLPVQKKPKVASPCKNMSQSLKNSTVIEKTKNYFVFAKPAFPVKKFANIKAKEKILSTTDTSTTEKLISKSRGTLSDTIISVRNNDDGPSDTSTDEDTVLADGHLQASPKPTRKTTPKLIIRKKVKNTPTKPTRKVLKEENGKINLFNLRSTKQYYIYFL